LDLNLIDETALFTGSEEDSIDLSAGEIDIHRVRHLKAAEAA
jgi:hypothetical protein